MSEFELKRLDNIKRNEEFLKNIGIESVKPTPLEARVKYRSSPQKRGNSGLIKAFQPSRISLRLLEKPAPTFDESVIENFSALEDTVRNAKKHKTQSRPPIERLPPDPDTSRAINAQLEPMLSTENLGFKVSDFGKAYVMAQFNGGLLPRFSKYSGVAEFKNCVILWVNIGKEVSDYPNTFSKSGRNINWFGGNKMTSDTPVISRLIEAGKRKTTDLSDGKDRVILFVRQTEENYCCLGQLSYISYDVECHPVTFQWSLLDYDILKTRTDFTKVIAEHGIKI